MSYKTILAAVDMDESNQEVCSKAHDLAKSNNAKLYLIHVLKTSVPVMTPTAIGGGAIVAELSEEDYKKIREHATKNLDEIAIKLGDIVVETKLTESVDTCESIHDEAKRINADLIVAGSHGRHGLSLFLSGSTAGRLLKDSPCDVLAVLVEHE